LDVNKCMILSVVFPQVAAMSGSSCGGATNGLEAVCSETDLRSNFVWAFSIGSEFTMFSCATYGFQMIENELAYLNWLQSYCTVVQACDAEFVEGFLK